MRAWNYAIAAGDRFEESFSLGHFKAPGYHLRVYAPNGFYREFKGDRQDPPLVIGYQPEQHHLDPSQLTGNLEITLHNRSGKNLTVLVEDLAYGQPTVHLTVEPGKQKTVIDLSNSHRWYDARIIVEDYDSFAQHVAGRVETGQAGKTDPQMG